MALDISDIDTVRQWPMTRDPFASVKDYALWKQWFRWLRPAHRKAHAEYWKRRADWIGQKNFEDYFEKADRTITRDKWEYLQLRKSWYQIPFHWDELTLPGVKNILDLGCGDGDFTQRVADYIADAWKKTGGGQEITIVGIDLSPSRIKNAQNLCRAKDPRIKMEFHVGDAKKPIAFGDRHFDYSLNTGVLEILEDGPADAFVAELCRVTDKAIYTEDLADRYPGGFPREDLNPLFRPHGFEVTDRRLILTEPWSLKDNPQPCKVWPILRDQIVWAERA
jgi:SAM-dependent methyltransferase